ncbi:prenyltransferase [Planomicrobium sp. MB-3u-38]|uniref:prenyltransferase n=1 Tax=Planomicrobium sp. MB-3u-38 TaxID=2058318 RepID=UPI000C79E696|nr:prenyltransferase [Planomicrobium sp. MB-3u-38]PKH08628.1 1,4-dihydroxy-2-naphthoate prenyltransferase [Planomicrobium sp. MB-3u-38]
MINLMKTQNYSYRASWLALLRPMTLTGTISPAIAGGAFAAQTGTVDITVFIVFITSALLVQMAVNIFNDYFDFVHGQDIDKWEETESSGFSKKPIFSQLPAVAAALLLIAAVLGIWLAVHSSYWILVVGAISIAAGIYYSAGKPSLASIGAGELVAAVFLGFVVTSLAFVVEGGGFNWEIIAVAFPYAALIASMILVNNIRDIEKDRGFRCTLAITFGRRKAMMLLGFLITVPYIWLLGLNASGITGWPTAIVFLALPIAFWLRWKLREGAPREDERDAMKWAAWHHWVFGLLFAFGIAIG